MSWADAAIARLEDAHLCPVCEGARLTNRRCARCGADLTGQQGAALWNASVAAVQALRLRRSLLGSVPRRAPVPVPAGAAMPPAPLDGRTAAAQATPVAQVAQVAQLAQAAPAAHTPDATTPAPRIPVAASRPRPRAGASLPSVLATAGAGLFAIAAIVFTFFNPELADRSVRTWIIAGVTAAFLTGAWLLARRRLQSSAEAVGGLGLVFAGLDVQAIAASFGEGAGWVPAAVATAAGGALMLAAALRAGIRVWLWTSVLAIAAAPAMLGFGATGGLEAALWPAASAFAATGLMTLLPRFAAWFPARRADAAAAPTVLAVRDGSGGTGAPETAVHAPRGPLVAELAALTVLQAVVTALAVGRGALTDDGSIAFAAVLAVLAVHAVLAAVRTIPRAWAFIGGGLAVGAAVFAVIAAVPVGSAGFEWSIAVPPAGAVIALLTGALMPLPRRTPRLPLAVGAGLAAGMTSAPAVLTGLYVGASLLRMLDGGADQEGPLLGPVTWAMLVALALISAGFGAFALCTRARPEIRPLRGAALVVTVLYATAAVLCLAASRALPLPVGIAVLLLVTAVTAVVVARKEPAGRPLRILIVVAAHLGLVVAVLVAWQNRELVPYAGIATLAVLGFVARMLPAPQRFLHVGAGCAYALVLVGTALSLAGVDGIPLLALTASAGLLGAVVATFLPIIGARDWQAVLVVATVPFVAGVVQVVFERSGWTALSTGLMLALALTLLVTRRAGLTAVIRTLAAGLLVPTLAVVILCLGAQLLVQSGSPVVLPIIAALIALVLPSGRMIRDGLVGQGRSHATADAARAAIEASALLTGTIAVALALLREAAGFGTACLVLILLGVGGALTSLLAGRRYGWWLAGVAFTGALWSLWGLRGVGLPEAYLLPPALGAALIAVVLTLRGVRAVPLLTAGLTGAVVPSLALLATGSGSDAVPWRAHALLASGWLLLGLVALVGRDSGVSPRRLRPLRTPGLLLASVAALGGTVQAVRWGSGVDSSPVPGGAGGVFLLCLGVSAVAALALLTAGRMLRSTLPDGRVHSRWLVVAAMVALGAGVWPAIAEDWFVIWGMWALMLGWLTVLVVVALRSRSGPRATAPPAWVSFGLAFVTAVVAWSPRELRVEAFSLPLGLFLLAAGVIGLRRAGAGDRADTACVAGLGDWPRGPHGSWTLLAPGLIVTMSASVVSTFTDPLTWRAILVMVLALIAVLVGAARRLAAPFAVGLIALPVENVLVFAVQLGRGIDAMPWWITLAAVGAVLLIIAVAGERREGAGQGVVARVRDLR